MPSKKVKQFVLLAVILSDIKQVNITGLKRLYIKRLSVIVILNGKIVHHFTSRPITCSTKRKMLHGK